VGLFRFYNYVDHCWRGGRVVECVGLENRFTRKGNEGSNPSLSAESLTNSGVGTSPRKGTEGNGEYLSGTVPMQIGCKPDPSRPSIPDTLSRSWPHLPEHVKLAILALVEPYRHLGTGAG
jgi:hypothetical protein